MAGYGWGRAGMAVAAGLPGVPPLTLPPKDRCFAATKEIFHTPMPRWVGGLINSQGLLGILAGILRDSSR